MKKGGKSGAQLKRSLNKYKASCSGKRKKSARCKKLLLKNKSLRETYLKKSRGGRTANLKKIALEIPLDGKKICYKNTKGKRVCKKPSNIPKRDKLLLERRKLRRSMTSKRRNKRSM